jgi:hypothetical protein
MVYFLAVLFIFLAFFFPPKAACLAARRADLPLAGLDGRKKAGNPPLLLTDLSTRRIIVSHPGLSTTFGQDLSLFSAALIGDNRSNVNPLILSRWARRTGGVRSTAGLRVEPFLDPGETVPACAERLTRMGCTLEGMWPLVDFLAAHLEVEWLWVFAIGEDCRWVEGLLPYACIAGRHRRLGMIDSHDKYNSRRGVLVSNANDLR